MGIFHEGSGLGNQLARYVMTRVKALGMGVDFGMVGEFKGKSFMNLDMGKPVPFKSHVEMPAGKVVVECDWPIYQEDPWNPDYNFKINDNTIIDGEFQGEKYFEHRLDEIREWLTPDHPYLEDTDAPEGFCVIGFRGGEYVHTNWFLPQSYWDKAIAEMRKINPDMKFEVRTDDVETARNFFPDFYVAHDMALDWMHIRKAPYLILANSSFYILPALLNQRVKKIIAPKFWAGYNQGKWQLPQNEYKQFHYI